MREQGKVWFTLKAGIFDEKNQMNYGLDLLAKSSISSNLATTSTLTHCSQTGMYADGKVTFE